MYSYGNVVLLDRVDFLLVILGRYELHSILLSLKKYKEQNLLDVYIKFMIVY